MTDFVGTRRWFYTTSDLDSRLDRVKDRVNISGAAVEGLTRAIEQAEQEARDGQPARRRRLPLEDA